MKQFKINKNQQINSIIEHTPIMQHYLEKASDIDALNQELKNMLDPSIRDHCNCANIRHNTIILATPSPAWNHTLRFIIPELLTKLRKKRRWAHIKDIKIIVLPRRHDLYQKCARKPLKISDNNIQLLTKVAEYCNNAKLKSAIFSLTKKLKAK